VRSTRVVCPFWLSFLVLISPTWAAAAVAIGGSWSPPVDGPVVRGFDPPDSPFGPGHLGVDYGVAPGTPVHAAGDGVVVFAGRVAAALHVVTLHAGDIRTSDSFLATVAVVSGQRVRRGALLGTTGGTGDGHGPGVLHFGVRVGAEYIDPLLLFAPPDLAAVVHLAEPQHGGGAVASSGVLAERAALAAELRVDGRGRSSPPAWWHDPVGMVPESPAAGPTPLGGAALHVVDTTRPPPGPPGAVPAAVGTAVLAGSFGVVGGVRARRRRGRRGPNQPLRPPTTLHPGPDAPGLWNRARHSGGPSTETTDTTRP
jgi:murein DD-endopeptidase MepM/ murein hydrolase activator NlpD